MRSALSVLVVATIGALPAPSYSQSWGEIGAASLELSVEEFKAQYGATLQYNAPAEVQGVAKQVLDGIEDQRRKLLEAETLLKAGSTTARAYIDSTGLLIGTAGGAPLGGLAVADQIFEVVHTIMIKPELDKIRAGYDNDVANLIASQLDRAMQLKDLKKLAEAGNAGAYQEAAQKIWLEVGSAISAEVLSALPQTEQLAVFQQGTRTLFNLLKGSVDGQFKLNETQIGGLTRNVGEIRRALRLVEDKQNKISNAFQAGLAETKQGTNLALGKLQQNLQAMQETAAWQQLGTDQRVAALQAGWFPEISDNDRKAKIEQLRTVREIEKITRPAIIGSEIAGGLVQAAKNLHLDQSVISGLENAKKNLDTVQNWANVATNIAMGNYLGAFSAATGLLGGDGGQDASAAQHAQIMAALGQINQKLDTVIKLQQQTLAEIGNVRQDIRVLSASLNRRLNAIEENQYKIIERLLGLSWQIQGSEDCRWMRDNLRENAAFHQYSPATGNFASYAKRAEYYRNNLDRMAACRRFITAVVQANADGMIQDFFEVRPAPDVLAKLAKDDTQAKATIAGLSNASLYEAMRRYHLRAVNLTDVGLPDCDTNLFQLMSATPLVYGSFLDEAARRSCKAAYQTKGGKVLRFSKSIDRQLDLDRLVEVCDLLDSFARFRLFENAKFDDLRPLSEIAQTNEFARNEVMSAYRSFRDVLAVAAAQQAILSGSVVGDVAASALRASGFRITTDDCQGTAPGKPYRDAICAARDLYGRVASEVTARRSELSSTRDSKRADELRAVLNSLRQGAQQQLTEPDKPELKDKSVTGKIFATVARMNAQNCIFDFDGLPAIDKVLFNDQTKTDAIAFWDHALLTCLMERNQFFASNVTKVLVRNELKDRGRNFYDYAGSTLVDSPLIMQGLLPEWPLSLSRSGDYPRWDLLVEDMFGWPVQYPLPLWIDIEPALAGGKGGPKVLSTETPAHRTISLLRTRVDGKILELSICGEKSGNAACTDEQKRLLRNVVLSASGKQ